MAGLVTMIDKGSMAVSLAECKAYLRLERDDDDALIAGVIRTAMALCEAFIGQWLIVREGEQRLASDGGWQSLAALPVVSITGLYGMGSPAPGVAYETDIDVSGMGWVRLADADAISAPSVRFLAGIGRDWNDVPEPLRQGLIRLVAHLYTHRDAADAGAPPAAVAALWRPWRRLRLS